MKFIRVLSRVAVLSLAAAAFTALTGVYGSSAHLPVPSPDSQVERRHRPSTAHLSEFPEFVGEGMLLIFFAVSGRIVLRLRLSPPSRSEGQPILLGLYQEPKTAKSGW